MALCLLQRSPVKGTSGLPRGPVGNPVEPSPLKLSRRHAEVKAAARLPRSSKTRIDIDADVDVDTDVYVDVDVNVWLD